MKRVHSRSAPRRGVPCVVPALVAVVAGAALACTDPATAPDDALRPGAGVAASQSATDSAGVAAARDSGNQGHGHGADGDPPGLALGRPELPSPIALATFTDVAALGGWIERFDVNPSDPATWVRPVTPWAPANWAVVRHSREPATWDDMEDMSAWHQAGTCNAPPLTHVVSSWDESVFLCRNHMMTAVNASGYAVTYLTPDRMLDWSAGEAVLRWDVTSLRNTARDWLDVWITPYEDNLQLPLEDSLPDLNGGPRRGLHVRMTAERLRSAWQGEVLDEHRPRALPRASAEGAESRMPPAANVPAWGRQSATRRDTFELRISRGRVRLGMPRYGIWWIDAPVAGLPFTRGVVQLGHHSFNPGGDGGTATTWHWDNVGMAPAVPFTIVNATRRAADAAAPALAFARLAPAGAHLRFGAWIEGGFQLQVSVDGGRKWRAAERQAQARVNAGRFQSYWHPVPAGTAEVRFRAVADDGRKDRDKGQDTEDDDRSGAGARWTVRDATIWSQRAG